MPVNSRTDKDRVLTAKASFDSIYDRPDPRAYYRTLGTLDYQITHHAQQVFSAVLAAGWPQDANPPTVMDLCCSYGLNAAMLGCDVTMTELCKHYSEPSSQNWTPDELLAADRVYYAGLRRQDAPNLIGVDSSAPAIRYALDAGLLDAGFAENLEEHEPSDALQAAVDTTDLITVSGGVGYISVRSFQRLLKATADPPWIAALVLRGVDYTPIASFLDSTGLITEKLTTRTFRQRRFADDGERRQILEALADKGIAVKGKETDGYLHAELFVSRPSSSAAQVTLDRLISPDAAASRD